MASLIERLRKASTVDAEILTKSQTIQAKDVVSTPVPGLNIALSGSISGGLTPGLTIFAGPSKHFKSLYSLICASSYLKAHPDAVCIFYDNEFGSPVSYFTSAGIDPERVLHSPIADWEQLIHDASVQLAELKRGDKVVIVVDSIGNLASKKEITDALNGDEKADMTRAKRAKSFFRIVTPQLTMKDIPMIVIAHTYDTLEMYSKKVVSGGTGAYYSADNIFIIGRAQEKEGTGAKAELTGYEFKINIEKSRFVREKSVVPITVKFDGGIQRWSGLFDIALTTGLIKKIDGSKSYQVVGHESFGEFARAEVENSSKFWRQVITETDFPDRVEREFKVSSGKLITEDNTSPDDNDEE
ncbi:RecA-like recombination protein [Rhizobium phage RHph_I1_18]|nr:RecA-like recombination protein [Rhizobium phage RHph_I1_18]